MSEMRFKVGRKDSRGRGGRLLAAGVLGFAVALVVSNGVGAQETSFWKEAGGEVLASPSEEGISRLIGHLSSEGVSPDEVYEGLHDWRTSGEVTTGEFVRVEIPCTDGVNRHFFYRVPDSYTHEEKIPLLFYLHGSVNRQDLPDVEDGFLEDHPYADWATANGYVIVLPTGQAGAVWWDPVGVANLRNILHYVKRTFNIDDDRVYVTGFSDGGSGSFFLAYCSPTDFAAFMPLCGHPAVGTFGPETPTFLPNWGNRPLYVINNGQDRLYPAAKLLPAYQLALSARADLFFRDYPDYGHEPTFFEKEIPHMERFFRTHVRERFPGKIVWETVGPPYNRCDWFSVDSVYASPCVGPYQDYNMLLVRDRAVVGFMVDSEYEGEGVRVDSVVEGDDRPAHRMGLQAGDIVVSFDGVPTPDYDALRGVLGAKVAGESFTITVVRDGERIAMQDHFNQPEPYWMLVRDAPSAKFEATYAANHFTLTGNRFARVSIFLHRDMVDLSEPVSVSFNGQEVWSGLVHPDVEFMVRDFFTNRDRSRIHEGRIEIDLAQAIMAAAASTSD